MSDSYLDRLPSHEQKRLKKMMSASAYERLRESVKGPEDLEKELERSEKMAELHFALESEPHLQEQARSSVAEGLEKNFDKALEHPKDLSPHVKNALQNGKFTVAVKPHPVDHHDVLVVLPEGSVHDKVVLSKTSSEHLMNQLSGQSVKDS